MTIGAPYGERYGEQAYGSDQLESINPVVDAVEPAAGEEFVDPNVTVRVRVPRDVVDPWSIEVDRGGGGGFELALTYDAGATFETPYSGPASAVVPEVGVYDVSVDSREAFDVLAAVSVRVTGEDASGNPVEIQ